MHTDCWIQQVTTRVGAVSCWIQPSVSPKQVVGCTCVFNSELDQLIRKSSVIWTVSENCSQVLGKTVFATNESNFCRNCQLTYCVRYHLERRLQPLQTRCATVANSFLRQSRTLFATASKTFKYVENKRKHDSENESHSGRFQPSLISKHIKRACMQILLDTTVRNLKYPYRVD